MEDRAFWAKAADVSRDFFNRVPAPETGLTPDRSNFDGTPTTGFDGKPTPFAARLVALREQLERGLLVVAQGPARDGIERSACRTFCTSQGIDTFADRYTLDGKPLSTTHSTGMAATAAVGSLAAPDGPTAKAFVDALWNMPVPSGELRYYDGMLYLMSMMHCSGEFRIIEPRAVSH